MPNNSIQWTVKSDVSLRYTLLSTVHWMLDDRHFFHYYFDGDENDLVMLSIVIFGE